MYDTRYGKAENKKVAIYARVSTEHEAQLSALENQKDWYSQLIGNHPEWEIVKMYADEGVTGTAAYKRRSFMQMIDDAINGQFDLILTREVSRFARNTVDTLSYTRKLKKHNVEVYFISDGIKTFDPDGELRLTIMATLAQEESRKTSARVKCGQQTSMEKGVVYGNGNVLGYDRVGRELVVNQEQAQTVRMIFDWYTEGKGLRDIQYELEKRGIKTATGKSNWHQGTIFHILQNPIYIGKLTYHKYYTPDFLEQKKKLNHGQLDILQVDGTHEHIISDEQFALVQQIFERHHSVRREMELLGSKSLGKKKPSDVWVKKLECECGHRFNRKACATKTNGTNERAYMCYRQIRYGTYKSRSRRGITTDDTCRTPMISDWKLQLMANEIFQNCINDSSEILGLVRSMLKRHIRDKEVPRTDPGKKEDIIEEIERIRKRLEKCVELRIEGEITKEMFQRKKTEYETRIDDLSVILKEFTGSMDVEESNLAEKKVEEVESLIEVLKREVEQSGGMNPGMISEGIIDAFVERIVSHSDSYDWYLRYAHGGKTDPGAEKMEVAEIIVTAEKAAAFRNLQGKKLRRDLWHDLKVHVYV